MSVTHDSAQTGAKAKPSQQASVGELNEIVFSRRSATFSRLAEQNPQPRPFFRSAIEQIVLQHQASAVAIRARLGADTFEETSVSPGVNEKLVPRLKQHIAEFLEQVRGEKNTVVRMSATKEAQGSLAFIYMPFPESHLDDLVGSVIFVIHIASEGELKICVAELDAAMTAIRSYLPKQETPKVSDTVKTEGDESFDAFARASAYQNTRQFAFALVNSIARRYGYEQVNLGLVNQKRTTVFAVSGVDTFKASSPGIVDIQQVMDEALDHGATALFHPERQPLDFPILPIHRNWGEKTRSTIASILLFENEKCVAVLCVRRNAREALLPEELQQIEESVKPYGSAITIMQRADRTVGDQLKESVSQTVTSIRTPRTMLGKAGRIAILVSLLFFCFGWLPYHPKTACNLVPANLTHTLAPFEMRLDEVHVAAGDQVKAGQVLARFDTREFDISRKGILAQQEQIEVAVRAALAKGEIAEASLAKAQVRVLQAELEAIDAKIDRCTVRAPQEGMVVTADLKQKVGQVFPQGDPILSFAPLDHWELELQVPERIARFIQAGQSGKFAPVARPQEHFTFKINTISGAAELVEGQSVFIATATIDEKAAWMRQGMEGIASTHTGYRPVFWIALHRVYELARWKFWF